MTRGEGLVVGSYRGWKVQIVVLVLVGGTLVGKLWVLGSGEWVVVFVDRRPGKSGDNPGFTVQYGTLSLSVCVCLSKLYVHTSNVQHTLTNTLLYTKTHA